MTDANSAGARPASREAATVSCGARKDVAAVIVNWNTCSLLRACLQSLQHEQSRLRTVVVVDNASSDGSASMVRTEFRWAHLVEPGWNSGYAGGNNLGLAEAHEPYLLLLNPDTELEAGSVDRLSAFLDDHPSAAVVAPQLLSRDGSIQRSCRSFPEPLALIAETLGIWWLARRIPFVRAYRMSGWEHDSVRQVDQPMGSALMVRREAVAEVGGMDEQFPLFFNEVDWLYRMRKAGWEIWFTPGVRVLHHHGASTRQVWVRAAWLSHTGLHAFYRKHYRSRLNPFLYTLIVGAIYLRAVATVGWRVLQRLLARVKRP